ncbi:hypothetical protein [Nostoc sp. PCC 7107]|uniref:hypothetical protein n=1 Tax=Nostoc sp. PCC 7107 TaxID=317936 RepID=UPI0002FABD18|nr:hypothetical protein [Nostoc sp. PCC 7107]
MEFFDSYQMVGWVEAHKRHQKPHDTGLRRNPTPIAGLIFVVEKFCGFRRIICWVTLSLHPTYG